MVAQTQTIKIMAYIDSSCVKAIEFAKTLNPNIKIDNGINWIWAYGFTSNEDANKFNKYCENNNCETRGVYSGSVKGTYDVRFR
jgi:hypothetical protein